MNFFDSLLNIDINKRNTFQIIWWWELRRILYNLIIIICLIISLTLMGFAASGRVDLEPGEDLYEPIMIPIFLILCNVGYSLGWLTEIFIKKSKTYGKRMFKIGLLFTLFWTFLPSILWMFTAIIEEIKELI